MENKNNTTLLISLNFKNQIRSRSLVPDTTDLKSGVSLDSQIEGALIKNAKKTYERQEIDYSR